MLPVHPAVDSSELPLESLVVSDNHYNEIRNKLRDPNERNDTGDTLLHVAARSIVYNTCVLKLLIDRGANVNATTPRGHTPLHFAVCSRQNETVVTLIEAGASINSTDYLQRRALHFAVGAQWSRPPVPVVNAGYSMRVVKTLLRNPETDLNPVDAMGETPLMWAVKRRYYSGVRALLKKGADPDIPDNDNRTPLHEALSVRKPSLSIVFKLLTNGAGIYCVDKWGRTPVDVLLSIVHDEKTLLFAGMCVRLIALRYHIRKSLKRQLEKFPALSDYLERCCKEVGLMRKHVICDNFTVHDFLCDCYQSQEPGEDIYKLKNVILSSGSYVEYHNLILHGMRNPYLSRQMPRNMPNRSIFPINIAILEHLFL